MKKYPLRRQLRQTGANPTEAKQLMELADQLEHLSFRGLPSDKKRQIAEIPGRRVRYIHIAPRYALGGAMAIALVLVGFAQTAQPGSALYDVKRGTNEVRTLVQPGYVETLTEKQETEIEQLKQEQAAPEKIEQAERDYERTKERAKQWEQKKSDRQKQQNGDKKGQDNRRNNKSESSDKARDEKLNNWWQNPDGNR